MSYEYSFVEIWNRFESLSLYHLETENPSGQLLCVALSWKGSALSKNWKLACFFSNAFQIRGKHGWQDACDEPYCNTFRCLERRPSSFSSKSERRVYFSSPERLPAVRRPFRASRAPFHKYSSHRLVRGKIIQRISDHADCISPKPHRCKLHLANCNILELRRNVCSMQSCSTNVFPWYKWPVKTLRLLELLQSPPICWCVVRSESPMNQSCCRCQRWWCVRYLSFQSWHLTLIFLNGGKGYGRSLWFVSV